MSGISPTAAPLFPVNLNDPLTAIIAGLWRQNQLAAPLTAQSRQQMWLFSQHFSDVRVT